MLNQEKVTQALKVYMGCVEYPNCSGFEALELFPARDFLYDAQPLLNEKDKLELKELDNKLKQNVSIIYKELSEIMSLSETRSTKLISDKQWWWFLDELIDKQTN
jgi:hypothetical protein